MSDYNGPSVDPTNPQATLRATSELMREGDFPTTERLLGWALDFNPEHAGLLRRMSELRWNEGKVDEAVNWAEQALTADRGDAENYAHLGLLRMRQGRYTDADELVVRAIEMKPNNPAYLRRLADIMTQLGRGHEAVDLAERAAALRPQALHGHLFLAGLQQRYGDFEGAEASILTGLEQVPDNATALRRMARCRLGLGDVDGARSWARRAREAASDDPANYDLEAELALMSDDLSGAEEALRMAAGLTQASGHYKRRLSDVLLRRGDCDGALVWAERAIAEHPQDLAGHNHLASLRIAQGQHDDAYAALEAAVAAAKPRDAIVLMRRLSSLAHQSGRQEDATGWAERAVAANPIDPENHAHLAWLYLQRSELASARKAAQRAQELAPGSGLHSRSISDIAWRQGEPEAALDWAARAIAVHPTDAQNYAHQATLLMQQGKNRVAEKSLTRAVELAPLSIGLLTRLSDLKMRLGKQDEAFTLAERAISLRPGDLNGLNHLATLHLRLGNLNEGYEILCRAAEIEPGNVPLLRRLADAAQRRGEDAAALVWLRQALDINPRDLHSYNQLATLELARGDSAAAEAALTRATELAGTNPGFHRRLSEVLSRRGDEQGALYWAERAISDFPNDPTGLIQFGNLHLAAGRLDEAEAAYTLAYEMATIPLQTSGPLHRLSEVATRRNDIRAALAWSAKAIEVGPREPGAYNHLAGLHLAYGNLAAAQRAAQTAVDLAPTDVAALRRLSDIALRQGKIDLALDLARQAITANPVDPHSHNHEASVLLAAGDHAGAQASVEKALKFAPMDVTLLRRADFLRAVSEGATAHP